MTLPSPLSACIIPVVVLLQSELVSFCHHSDETLHGPALEQQTTVCGLRDVILFPTPTATLRLGHDMLSFKRHPDGRGPDHDGYQ